MGFGYTWKCKTCGNEITLSGPWEFYRDNEGKRKPYGHPTPNTEEARKAGVKGFSEALYCSKCREVRDAITQEFRKPVINDNHWIRSYDDDCIRVEPKCDKCGMGLKGNLEEKDICPKCNKGTFEVSDRWIS
jgi:hypothetical protein